MCNASKRFGTLFGCPSTQRLLGSPVLALLLRWSWMIVHHNKKELHRGPLGTEDCSIMGPHSYGNPHMEHESCDHRPSPHLSDHNFSFPRNITTNLDIRGLLHERIR